MMRAFGIAAIVAIVVSVVVSEPRPALSGTGLAVSGALAAFLAGLALARPWAGGPDSTRIAGLALVGASSCAFAGLQPGSAGYAAIYFVVVVAGARLERTPAILVSGLTLAAEVLVLALAREDSAAHIVGLLFSVVPWFLVMRLLRELLAGRERAEAMVEELQASRSAVAQSAALAERGRVARDMHDVLAHTLSALSLQLEGARLMARDRGSDPEVVESLERAHHLAAGGLAEARDAIGALRGDAMPGPERLRSLTEGFPGDARLVVDGTPRALESEARLALYRTAQEALTNVSRHSAADYVEVRLAYEPGGTRLVVRDVGPGAPVAVGPGAGGGYGLTGMRERAELLGGELSAGPTRDGFEVELWLPA
jgi:signal transduction histidine kinase